MGIFSSDRKTTKYETTNQTDASSFQTGLQADDNEGSISSIGIRDGNSNTVTTTDFGSVKEAIGLSGSVVNAQTDMTKNYIESAEYLAKNAQNNALDMSKISQDNARDMSGDVLDVAYDLTKITQNNALDSSKLTQNNALDLSKRFQDDSLYLTSKTQANAMKFLDYGRDTIKDTLAYGEKATTGALKFANNSLKSDQGETAGLIKWGTGLAALVLMSFAFMKVRK